MYSVVQEAEIGQGLTTLLGIFNTTDVVLSAHYRTLEIHWISGSINRYSISYVYKVFAKDST